MSRLSRFLHLERARPPEDRSEQVSHVSARFGGIEATRDHASTPSTEPDPFAPPPEAELELALAPEPSPKARQRRARAEAALEEAREELVERQEVQATAKRGVAFGPLGRLSLRDRAIALGVSALAFAVAAELFGHLVWAGFPVVLAILVATAFADRD